MKGLEGGASGGTEIEVWVEEYTSATGCNWVPERIVVIVFDLVWLFGRYDLVHGVLND